jgi:predicted transcriptional regulator
MSAIEQEILTALKTYQWEPTATIYNFAERLMYSESYVRRALETLADAGQLEKVIEGTTHGKPRYVYQLTSKCPN